MGASQLPCSQAWPLATWEVSVLALLPASPMAALSLCLIHSPWWPDGAAVRVDAKSSLRPGAQQALTSAPSPLSALLSPQLLFSLWPPCCVSIC